MTGVSMTVSFDAVAARYALSALKAVGADLHPLLDEVGAAGESQTRMRFITTTAPDGTAWKVSKRAAKGGTPTLTLKGHLRDELHYAVDGDDAVEWGSSLVYAGVHQGGLTIHHPGGTKFFIKDGKAHFISNHSEMAAWAFPETRPHDIPMPKREFLGISPSDGEEFLDIVKRREAEALAKGH